jgi:hypothetical protein
MFNAGAAILRIGSKIGLSIGVIRVHQRLSTRSGAPFSRPTAPFRAKCLWKEEWWRAAVPVSSRLSFNLPKARWLDARALSCMHAAPERRWTLQALAAEAGRSRAIFAQRFSVLAGQGILIYSTAWRTHVLQVCCLMKPATLEPWPAGWATDQKQPSPSHLNAGPGSRGAGIAIGCP